MFILTFREIKILDLLLNKEFITIEEIMQRCGISIRTVQAELRVLKKAVHDLELPFQITNQRGKGYTLDYDLDNLEVMDEIKRYCREYLNQNINHLFQNNYRVPLICQQLFLSDGYLKIEELAQVLHVSESTIAKDLHQVRNFLDWYNLKIESTPYNGMKIKGPIMGQRCCMIDLFVFYKSRFSPKEAYGDFKQYGFANSQVAQVASLLRQKMKRFPTSITDLGFNRIVRYVLLLPQFPTIKNLLVADCSILPEFQLANAVLQCYPAFNHKTEKTALTLFILVNSEFERFIKDQNFWRKLIPDLDPTFRQVIKLIYQNYQLNIPQNSDLLTLLGEFTCQYLLKKKFALQQNGEDYTSQQNIRKLPASSALATEIIFALPQWTAGDFYDQLFLNLVMAIYNYICRLQNEYYPTHILLVNGFGKVANETLFRKLTLNHHLQINFDQRYLYELPNLDFSKYDYMLISRDIDIDLNDIPLPKLKFDFFMPAGFPFELWGQLLMNKRKIGAVTTYLRDPISIYLQGSQEEIVQQISKYIYQHSHYPRLMDLTQFTNHLKICLFNATDNNTTTLKYLNLFTDQHLDHMSFIFHLTTPLTIRHHLVTGFQIIFLIGTKGLLEIKNGDSELRRYFEN